MSEKKQTGPNEDTAKNQDELLDVKKQEEQSCERVRKEVEAQLKKKKKGKVNELKKCNDCPIEHDEWVVINSPFEASLLNTGHDGAGGIIPSGGGTDLFWEAGVGDSSGPGSVGSWIPAYVYKDNAWISSPFNNANWISVFSDSAHEENVEIFFRNRFYLNSSVTPGQFSLEMKFFADNSVHEIYVNGAPQGIYHPAILPQNPSSPYNYRGFSAGNEVVISLTNDWKECENEIIVHVKSGPGKVGFLAQNAINCYEAPLPQLSPEIKVTWGDSECDCMETNDLEVFCISVCNPYSNVSFGNLTIGRIKIVDESGNPVPNLPDGTSSAEVLPLGPYCFGNIGPCGIVDEPIVSIDNCVTREFVIRTRGAVEGKYKLLLEGICFDLHHHLKTEACFGLTLCKD